MKLLIEHQKLDNIVEDVFIEPQILYIPSEEPLSPRRIQMIKRRKVILIFIILLIIFLFYNSFKAMNETIHFETIESDPDLSNGEELEAPLKPGILIDPTRKLTRKLPVSHVYVTSAYYYPTSKS